MHACAWCPIRLHSCFLKASCIVRSCLFSNTRYTRGIHYIIIGSFLYSNFPLLDHIHFQFLDLIHVLGKLLERMSLIWILRNTWCIILQFHIIEALSWVPCIRTSYAWCMVGACLSIWCILLKMQLNNCHLPNTYQSPSHARQIMVFGVWVEEGIEQVCRFQLFSMNVRYNVWYSTHCAVFRTAVSIWSSGLGTKLLLLLLGLIISFWYHVSSSLVFYYVQYYF